MSAGLLEKLVSAFHARSLMDRRQECDLHRIAAAPQPVYADQQPLPRAPYPTPQQKEVRRREMEQWRQRLGAKP